LQKFSREQEAMSVWSKLTHMLHRAPVFGVSLLLALPTISPVTATDDFSRAGTKDWPMVGGDWSNTRYSALAQINKQNVKQLGSAWISESFDEGSTSRSTPVVKDGLMFVTSGRIVYALNARTGKRTWSYSTVPDAKAGNAMPEKTDDPLNSLKGVPNGKGVGVGGGLVFVGLKDGHVIALRQKTGELAWVRQTGSDQPKKGQWAAVAPTYSNGVVLTGLSDGDHNLRGRLTALDAATGKQLWQMFSIPGPGEPGHETWPSFNDAWKFGGGGVWTNPSVDAELGIAYFTAGNASPAYAGDWRPGANLYTCSVLAVDLKTGKLKWYYQLMRHDVFEADLGVPLILYDARIGGRARKAVAALRADGYLFQLDRETGKPILPVEDRPVPQLASQATFPTQPFPVTGESLLMSCEDWKQEKIPAGFEVGCMLTAAASPPPSKDPQNILAPFPTVKGSLMAYSPQTGYFYAHGTSALFWPRRSQDPYFLNWVGVVPGLKSYAELAAIDSKTGRIAWRKRNPATSAPGSPLATAGGLMFRCVADGNVEAYDASTGDVLWRFQTGMGGGGGPAASYEIDGEQYLALSMGRVVWAFKLNGSAATAAAPEIAVQQEEFSGPLVETEEIETTSLHRSLIEPGRRYFIDEYTFSPYRARVKVGAGIVFVNNGIMRHEIVALDGSWGTGPLGPTQDAIVSFDKPGQYIYICKDHPWSYGQIVVTTDASNLGAGIPGAIDVDENSFARQAFRGKERYDVSCSACHGEDLAGRNTASPLLGTAFKLRWRNLAVADLFDNIRTTMPQSTPGSLERQAYIDIVAYLLRSNGLSPGEKGLSDDWQALKDTKLTTLQ
jgi:alcohol dehydrogenase (cytochrome c)